MSELRLILASGSRYRAEILNDLGLGFEQIPADIDETPLPGEKPRDLAERLGMEKAAAVAATLAGDDSWIVIGSDQVCHHQNRSFGKPGVRKNAIAQLSGFSGDWVTYSSSLALVCGDGHRSSLVEDYQCHFRDLSIDEIKAYVDLDQPWDCAGAIKIEKAAALLMQETKGRDINTLIGLPVMALQESLHALGYQIFDFIKPR